MNTGGVLALLPDVSRADVRSALEGIEGAGLHWCADVGEFLEELGRTSWSALLLHLDLETVELALVERIAGEDGAPPLYLTSSRSSVEALVAAERSGAAALLPHPPGSEGLRRELRPLLTESGDLQVPPLSTRSSGVVGASPQLLETFRTVARVAPSTATVLVSGESGTGKELVARALHEQSARSGEAFVTVNCAAIPDTLLEAELFGYDRGAFTGAVSGSLGRFGRADGGTLFLDEIGEMSPLLQSKLLRVLESGELERLGGSQARRVDVRVVAATNRDLREEVEKGRFREDLLFRLAVVEVVLPPLRERGDDVLALALHFASSFAERYARPVRALSGEAGRRLRGHAWPGNVRELRNVMDRAVLLARGGVIRSGDLHLGADAPRTSPRDETTGPPGFPPDLTLKEVEARHIRAVLEHTGGHIGQAATVLGIHRNTMTMKIREYGIDVERAAASAGTARATSIGHHD